jgi:hypothetical protein
VNGVLQVNKINGTAPILTKGSGSKATHVLNPAYTRTFIRTLYDVVRTAKTSDHIPAYLNGFFGPKGFFCSAKEKTVIAAYGFEADRSCG